MISASGQKRRFGDISVTSDLPLKADIHRIVRHVRKVPGADMRLVFVTKSAHTNIVEGMAGPRGLA
jgi:hypothetical protein